LSWLRIRR